MTLSRLLIANRGEVAIRIARAARDLGFRTVGINAADDMASLHTAHMDECHALPTGGAAAYLDQDAILAVAQKAGCTHLHPGYGFLSENADFAHRCADAGLRFVGPAADVLALFGDTIRAPAGRGTRCSGSARHHPAHESGRSTRLRPQERRGHAEGNEQWVERGKSVTRFEFGRLSGRGYAIGLSSGSEYLLRGRWMEVIQENPPYKFLWNDHFQLIGKRKAENYETHYKIRFVVNATGEMVIEFLDPTACETIYP